MDADFWHRKWATNQIGFHQDHPNDMLIRHVGALSLAAGARLFLPLCGKTLDIGWLCEQGYRVAGAELSELAIGQLFEDLNLTPAVTAQGALKLYHAENIDIFVGDIFDLTAAALGPVAAVYDRAALIALPADMRRDYARHLCRITKAAPQLLITLDYDQAELAGPPFAVDAAEVRRLYAAAYEIERLTTQDAHGALKKDMALSQSVWHLRPRSQ